MGFVGNYAPCGLSPQTDGMPVIHNKSRHLKQVTASLKSNILLCLESKGFEFLSAIHLSLMKHLLQFDLFQYDFSVWKRMKKSD